MKLLILTVTIFLIFPLHAFATSTLPLSAFLYPFSVVIVLPGFALFIFVHILMAIKKGVVTNLWLFLYFVALVMGVLILGGLIYFRVLTSNTWGFIYFSLVPILFVWVSIFGRDSDENN